MTVHCPVHDFDSAEKRRKGVAHSESEWDKLGPREYVYDDGVTMRRERTTAGWEQHI
jgi:hypothetical protein